MFITVISSCSIEPCITMQCLSLFLITFCDLKSTLILVQPPLFSSGYYLHGICSSILSLSIYLCLWVYCESPVDRISLDHVFFICSANLLLIHKGK